MKIDVFYNLLSYYSYNIDALPDFFVEVPMKQFLHSYKYSIPKFEMSREKIGNFTSPESSAKIAKTNVGPLS